MSAPAQKPRPAPVTTSAPSAGSRATVFTASMNSSSMRSVQALSFSGRLSVTSATRPRIS
jgi:hypothetical protein